MYREITEIEEIRDAQDRLTKSLKKILPVQSRNRTIGFPSGHFVETVRFAEGSGDDVFWWHGGADKNGRVYYNMFGHGNPASNETLEIDLQFNMPWKSFSRTRGGVFVRDEDGSVSLGHRGLITRGRSRIKKQDFIDSTSLPSFEMSTDTYKDPSVFFLTAPVSSGELLHSISYFVKEVRATADLIKKGQNVRSKRSLWLKDKLRDYFDEYIGKTRSKRKKRVVSRDCRHGEVVKALNEYYSKGGAKIYKGVKTDLWVELSDHVILFEVKTNTSTTSIYQGIGQLSLHAAVFKDLFLNKPIRKVLVLPIDDSDELARCLREMGIKILSYKFCDDGIELSRRRI